MFNYILPLKKSNPIDYGVIKKELEKIQASMKVKNITLCDYTPELDGILKD